MFTVLVIVCVALSVSGGIYAVGTLFAEEKTAVENRLSALTRHVSPLAMKKGENAVTSVTSNLNDAPNRLEKIVSRFVNVRQMLEQADIQIPTSRLLSYCGVCAGTGATIYLLFSPLKTMAPVIAGCFFFLPILFVWFKRRRRLKKFAAQLPEALDLIGQALRAGQSLAAGFQLVAQQTAAPLGPEFGRCFEEQNLGVPLEKAIMNMTTRVPNLDLRFFATSVVLQRQTGGDLAEILDKIAHLIRERFQIFGQIQALTGEGRLSGVVLLALPPALFVAMLFLNFNYIMMLFNEPLGRKMLAFAIFMQLLGAACIKKIITIKV
ncbi:MAG: type II secretion system F family protein [Planctomycetota bacterium]|jgi:tight adherence protein B|nr:type II secretion system F family protein [Blastopirellula sp.]